MNNYNSSDVTEGFTPFYPSNYNPIKRILNYKVYTYKWETIIEDSKTGSLKKIPTQQLPSWIASLGVIGHSEDVVVGGDFQQVKASQPHLFMDKHFNKLRSKCFAQARQLLKQTVFGPEVNNPSPAHMLKEPLYGKPLWMWRMGVKKRVPRAKAVDSAPKWADDERPPMVHPALQNPTRAEVIRTRQYIRRFTTKQCNRTPKMFQPILRLIVGEQLAPLLSNLSNEATKRMFATILISNVVIILICLYDMGQQWNEAHSKTIICVSLMAIMEAYFAATDKPNLISQVHDKILGALEYAGRLLSNQDREEDIRSPKMQGSYLKAGVKAMSLVFVGIMLIITSMTSCSTAAVDRVTKSLETSVRTAKNATYLTDTVQDLISEFVETEADAYSVQLQDLVKRANEVEQMPTYMLLSDPAAMTFAIEYPNKLVELQAAKLKDKRNVTALMQQANALAVKMNEKAVKVNLLKDKDNRVEPLGLMFVGPKHGGKTTLFKEVLWPKVCEIMEYPSKALYPIEASEKAKYYPVMRQESAAYVDDMFRAGTKCPVTQEIHTLISTAYKSAQGADVSAKEQPMRFACVAASTNVEPGIQHHLLPFPTEEHKVAFWSRFKFIYVTLPADIGSRCIRRKREEIIDPANYEIHYAEFHETQKCPIKVAKWSMDDLTNAVVDHLIANELQYLSKLEADMNRISTMPGVCNTVTNDIAQLHVRRNFLNNIRVSDTSTFGVTPEFLTTFVEAQIPSLMRNVVPLGGIAPMPRTDKRSGKSGGRQFCVLRAQGPVNTGKTTLMIEVGELLAKQTMRPFFHITTLPTTNPAGLTHNPLPTEPAIVLFDDLATRSNYFKYLNAVNTLHEETVILLATNEVIETTTPWNPFHRFVLWRQQIDRYVMDVPTELEGVCRRLGLAGYVETNGRSIVNGVGTNANITCPSAGLCHYNNKVYNHTEMKARLLEMAASFLQLNSPMELVYTAPPVLNNVDVYIRCESLDVLQNSLKTEGAMERLFMGVIPGAKLSLSTKAFTYFSRGIDASGFMHTGDLLADIRNYFPCLVTRARSSMPGCKVVVEISGMIRAAAVEGNKVYLNTTPCKFHIRQNNEFFSVLDIHDNLIAVISKDNKDLFIGPYTPDSGLDITTFMEVSTFLHNGELPSRMISQIFPERAVHNGWKDKLDGYVNMVITDPFYKILVIFLTAVSLCYVVKKAYDIISGFFKEADARKPKYNPNYSGPGKRLSKEEYDAMMEAARRGYRHDAGHDDIQGDDYDKYTFIQRNHPQIYRTAARREEQYDDYEWRDHNVADYRQYRALLKEDPVQNYTAKMMESLRENSGVIKTPIGTVRGVYLMGRYVMTVNHITISAPAVWCGKYNLQLAHSLPNRDLAIYEITTPISPGQPPFQPHVGFFKYLIEKEEDITDLLGGIVKFIDTRHGLSYNPGILGGFLGKTYDGYDNTTPQAMLDFMPCLQGDSRQQASEFAAMNQDGICGGVIVGYPFNKNGAFPKCIGVIANGSDNYFKLGGYKIAQDTVRAIIDPHNMKLHAKGSVAQDQILTHAHEGLTIGIAATHFHRCMDCKTPFSHTHIIHTEEYSKQNFNHLCVQCKKKSAMDAINSAELSVVRSAYPHLDQQVTDRATKLQFDKIRKNQSKRYKDSEADIFYVGLVPHQKEKPIREGLVLGGQEKFGQACQTIEEVVDRSKIFACEETGEQNIAYNQFRQYGCQPCDFKPHIPSYARAVSIYQEYKQLQYPDPELTSFKEAINGCKRPHHKFFTETSALAMDKSAGYLFNKLFGISKKGELFKQVPDPSNPNDTIYELADTDAAKYLKWRISMRLHEGIQGKVVLGFSKGQIKPEILPAHKVLIGKSRLFCIDDVDIIIASAMVNQYFMGQAKITRGKYWCQLGFDYNKEFTTLMHRITQVGGPIDAKDIMRQDKFIKRQLLLDQARVRASLKWNLKVPQDWQRLFNMPPELTPQQMLNLQLAVERWSLDAVTILPNGMTFMAPNGNRSGKFATTITASESNEISEIYSYVRIWRFKNEPSFFTKDCEELGLDPERVKKDPHFQWKHLQPDCIDGKAFRDDIAYPNYGDDNQNCSMKYPAPPTLREFYWRELGQILEPIDKAKDGLELPFLGREPIYVPEYHCYLPALRKSAIERLVYVIKHVTIGDIANNWFLALWEASLWSEEYYYEIKRKIMEILPRIPVPPQELIEVVDGHEPWEAVVSSILNTNPHALRAGAKNNRITEDNSLLTFGRELRHKFTDLKITRQYPSENSFFAFWPPCKSYKVKPLDTKPKMASLLTTIDLPYEDANGCAVRAYAINTNTDATLTFEREGDRHQAILNYAGMKFIGKEDSSKKKAAHACYLAASEDPLIATNAGMYLNTKDASLPDPGEYGLAIEAYMYEHGFYSYRREYMYGPPNVRTFAVTTEVNGVVGAGVAKPTLKEARRDSYEVLAKLLHLEFEDPSEFLEFAHTFFCDMRKGADGKYQQPVENIHFVFDGTRRTVAVTRNPSWIKVESNISVPLALIKYYNVRKNECVFTYSKLETIARDHVLASSMLELDTAPKMERTQERVAPVTSNNVPTGHSAVNATSGAEPIGEHATVAVGGLAPEYPQTGAVTGSTMETFGTLQLVNGKAVGFPDMQVNKKTLFDLATTPILADKFEISNTEVEGIVKRLYPYTPALGNVAGQLWAQCHKYFDIGVHIYWDVDGVPLQQGSMAIGWTDNIGVYKVGESLNMDWQATLQAIAWQQVEVKGKNAIDFVINDVRREGLCREYVYKRPTATTEGEFTIWPTTGPQPGYVAWIYQPFGNQFDTPMKINVKEKRCFTGDSTAWGFPGIQQISYAVRGMTRKLADSVDERKLQNESQLEGRILKDFISGDGQRGDSVICVDSTSVFFPKENKTRYTAYTAPIKHSSLISNATQAPQLVFQNPHEATGMSYDNESGQPRTLNVAYGEDVASTPKFHYIQEIGNLRKHTYISDEGQWYRFETREQLRSGEHAYMHTETFDHPSYIGEVQKADRIPALPGGFARVAVSNHPPFTVPETFDAEITMLGDYRLQRALEKEYANMSSGNSYLQFKLVNLQNQAIGIFRFRPDVGLLCNYPDNFPYAICRQFPEDVTFVDVRSVGQSEVLDPVDLAQFRSRKSPPTKHFWQPLVRQHYLLPPMDGDVVEAFKKLDTKPKMAMTLAALGAGMQAGGSSMQTLASIFESGKNRQHQKEMLNMANAWQSGENLANRQWTSGELYAGRQFSAGESWAQRGWQSGENTANRAHQLQQQRSSQLQQNRMAGLSGNNFAFSRQGRDASGLSFNRAAGTENWGHSSITPAGNALAHIENPAASFRNPNEDTDNADKPNLKPEAQATLKPELMEVIDSFNKQLNTSPKGSAESHA